MIFRGILFVPIPNRLVKFVEKEKMVTKDLFQFVLDSNICIEKINFPFLPQGEYHSILTALQYFSNICISSSGPENMEITDKNANKETALKSLCNLLGINLKNTVAFGDAQNDKKMLYAAGVGVAVANAKEEVLKIADCITLKRRGWGWLFY